MFGTQVMQSDVFTCGECCSAFTTLPSFLQHKVSCGQSDDNLQTSSAYGTQESVEYCTYSDYNTVQSNQIDHLQLVEGTPAARHQLMLTRQPLSAAAYPTYDVNNSSCNNTLTAAVVSSQLPVNHFDIFSTDSVPQQTSNTYSSYSNNADSSSYTYYNKSHVSNQNNNMEFLSDVLSAMEPIESCYDNRDTTNRFYVPDPLPSSYQSQKHFFRNSDESRPYQNSFSPFSQQLASCGGNNTLLKTCSNSVQANPTAIFHPFLDSQQPQITSSNIPTPSFPLYSNNMITSSSTSTGVTVQPTVNEALLPQLHAHCDQVVNSVNATVNTNYSELLDNIVADDVSVPTMSSPSNSKHLRVVSKQKSAVTKKSIKETFECTTCSAKFDRKSAFTVHLRSHTGERPFACLVCGKQFAQKNNVGKHLEGHRSWPQIFCMNSSQSLHRVSKSTSMDQFDKTFVLYADKSTALVTQQREFMVLEAGKNKENNKQQRQSVAAVSSSTTAGGSNQQVSSTNKQCLVLVDSRFECRFCSLRLASYSKLRTHVSKLHKDLRVFPCILRDCTDEFSELTQLLVHLERHRENNELKFDCWKCGHCCSNLFNLSEHWMLCNQSVAADNSTSTTNTSSNTKKLTTSSTSTTSIITTTLSSHSKSKSRQQYTCLQCHRRFRSVVALRSHQSIVHKEQHPCPVCSKVYSAEYYLRRHLDTKHSNKDVGHTCPDCGLVFDNRPNLVKHRRQHRRNQDCPACPKKFTSKYRLAAHATSVHSLLRSYKCPLTDCGQSYARYIQLRQHMLKHHRSLTSTGHQCTICRRRLPTLSSLHKHQKLHKSNRKAICSHCGKVFIRSTLLATHESHCQKQLSRRRTKGTTERSCQTTIQGDEPCTFVDSIDTTQEVYDDNIQQQQQFVEPMDEDPYANVPSLLQLLSHID